MVILEWWTKTSSPPSRSMKPYPFSFENHLTVPSANETPSYNKQTTTRAPSRRPPMKRGRTLTSDPWERKKAAPVTGRLDRVAEQHRDRHGPDAARHRRQEGRDLRGLRRDVADDAVLRPVDAHVDHRGADFDHVLRHDLRRADCHHEHVRLERVSREVDRSRVADLHRRVRLQKEVGDRLSDDVAA